MTMMDERVAARRKGVSEDRARRRLRWVLGTILVLLVAVAAYWLVRSPILSITEVDVAGAVESDPQGAVDELGMGTGVPTIDVRAGTIEAAIERDPWVADATVRVSWPGSLSIVVVEHVPVAAVESGDGPVLVSADGSAIESIDADTGLPTIALDASPIIGETTEDALMLGALAFIDAMSLDRRSGTTVTERDGGLIALVDGHEVRLGRPDEMAMKAVVLEELLDRGLESGAAIDLIAPMRPAVRNPEPQVEAEE